MTTTFKLNTFVQLTKSVMVRGVNGERSTTPAGTFGTIGWMSPTHVGVWVSSGRECEGRYVSAPRTSVQEC